MKFVIVYRKPFLFMSIRFICSSYFLKGHNNNVCYCAKLNIAYSSILILMCFNIIKAHLTQYANSRMEHISNISHNKKNIICFCLHKWMIFKCLIISYLIVNGHWNFSGSTSDSIMSVTHVNYVKLLILSRWRYPLLLYDFR